MEYAIEAEGLRKRFGHTQALDGIDLKARAGTVLGVAFVKVTPISHLVATVRGLMLGGPVRTDLAWTGLWMVILLVVFVPLALRAYRRRA